MRLKLILDPETFGALLRAAVRENRPADMEAEVLIRRALGLPVPWPAELSDERAAAEVRDAART